MKTKTNRRGLLITSSVSSAILSTLFMPSLFGAAHAQQAVATDEGEVVVVTGSRIRSPNNTSISPITTVGSEEIESLGVTRVEDLLNGLPQVFAGQGAMYSNGASGTATVNLRGLGSARTLVLINGRRLGPGIAGASAADLNFIPSSLIKRIDIVTGGASAAYGSDAIGGVVNFLMDDKFEGFELSATSNLYMHKNDNSTTQASNKARGFALPDENVSDGKGYEFALTFGAGLDGGKGHITSYAVYITNEEVLQGNRDYSACSLTGGNSFTCGGSGTANPARVGNFQVVGSGATATLVPRAAPINYVYNFGPTNYYMRPGDRFNLGTFANYKINEYAEAYGEMMYMHGKSIAQIAPGGIFASPQTINCDNAFATAQQLSAMCGANAGDPTKSFTGTVARRNVEGGGRRSAFEISSYRMVAGMRGEFKGWNYDGFISYHSVSGSQEQQNYFVTTHIANALIARKDSSGTIVCQSVIDGSDPACAPYNLFSAGGVSKEALTYLQAPGSGKGVSSQRIISLSVSGDLGQYGVKSPWADNGISVAFGFETREDVADYGADYLSKAGLLSGSGGASPDVSGSISVDDYYVEALVPLVDDKPFIKNLGLQVGYRTSDYVLSGKLDSYKIGFDYSPVSDLRIRTSIQRASRAPNINELYTPQVVQLDGSTDPCAGPVEKLAKAGNTQAKCALTGVTPALYGNIEENPAAQYNGLGGGNPLLKPEVSDTFSVGFVAKPSFIKGLTMSLDYFDIKIEDFIGGVGADLAITRCLNTANPYFCSLINREPTTGTLYLSPKGYIINTNLNVGSLQTKGYDFNVGYDLSLDQFGFGKWGDVRFTFIGTALDSYLTQPLPNDPTYDCAGLYGSKCGTPNPKWRHKLRATWETPYKDLAITAQWRYYGSVSLDAYSDDKQLNDPDLQRITDKNIGTYNYLDLSASISLTKNYSLRAGINNFFDRDPPIIGDGNGGPAGPYNGNTFAQVYDALGQYGYVTLKAKF